VVNRIALGVMKHIAEHEFFTRRERGSLLSDEEIVEATLRRYCEAGPTSMSREDRVAYGTEIMVHLLAMATVE